MFDNIYISPLVQRLLVSLGLITAFGILVHDTRFDQAVALALPVTAIGLIGSHFSGVDAGASHTHVERASMAQAFGGIPRVQARNDHRRYALERNQSRSDELGGNGVIWPSV
jgi:hypothetical protein